MFRMKVVVRAGQVQTCFAPSEPPPHPLPQFAYTAVVAFKSNTFKIQISHLCGFEQSMNNFLLMLQTSLDVNLQFSHNAKAVLCYHKGAYYSIGKALLLRSSTFVILECMQVIIAEHIKYKHSWPTRKAILSRSKDSISIL